NNIDKKDISMFMQSVQHYYKSVEGVELLNENERLSKMQVPYNLYDLSDKWIENNPNFTDQNCRITAFRLFNKFIISNSSLDYDKIDNTNLEMDYATLRDNPDAKFSKEDMNKFFNFFSNIKVSDFNDVKKSADEIAKEFKNRKISFKSDENISIINGYVPDEENNALFVGHTGVAINTKDGVIFIEKYGFELPYQITKFKNKEELKSYMIDRLKTSITGESQAYEPVVMENDKLM
ncbi:MAG: DUF4300 family protein, partial [Intestinibacter bartlettii]